MALTDEQETLYRMLELLAVQLKDAVEQERIADVIIDISPDGETTYTVVVSPR